MHSQVCVSAILLIVLGSALSQKPACQDFESWKEWDKYKWHLSVKHDPPGPVPSNGNNTYAWTDSGLKDTHPYLRSPIYGLVTPTTTMSLSYYLSSESDYIEAIFFNTDQNNATAYKQTLVTYHTDVWQTFSTRCDNCCWYGSECNGYLQLQAFIQDDGYVAVDTVSANGGQCLTKSTGKQPQAFG